jgi:protein NrfD
MLDDTRGPSRWDGSTYYGREQVKAAPFNNWLVGGYIFLAGLSGGAALISTILDLVRGDAGARVVRRGRLLSLLGPMVGSFGLIVDLHTPKRFYNMLRVFKITSPMSIGSWILIAFGGCSVLTSAAEMLGLRGMARAAQVPLAATGAGLGTYTASLLSATSTPLWAAAPCGTAVRFAGSSVAAGAAAMALGEGRTRLGRDLDKIALAALTVELAATLAADEAYRRTGVNAAFRTPSGRIERIGATVLGNAVPIGLFALSLMGRQRSPVLSGLAAALALTGSATMRISFMATGDESARRPEISMRFAQPDNLRRLPRWQIKHRK